MKCAAGTPYVMQPETEHVLKPGRASKIQHAFRNRRDHVCRENVITSSEQGLCRKRLHKGKPPPGPTPLPLVGNFLQMKSSEILKSLLKLNEKYGPVFTVYFGSRPVLILCGHQAVKEALIDKAEEFSGRVCMPSMVPTFQGYGVGFANGERWKELRRFCLAVLRSFGMGKKSIEQRLQEEAQFLLEEFRKTKAKVHEEIDRVIGHDRVPNTEDRRQMPYTDAVIHEVQRCSDVLPMSVAHMVTCDTEFRGYLIPKGMTVYPILSTVLHDPTMFKSPNVFNPENFLDENGRFKKNDAFVPFSSGKRNCLGESLARMELFLFFSTILQSFQLKSLVPPEDIDLTPQKSGFTNIPPFCHLSVIPR
nr:PREDICTED: cytochrome P450 2B11 [Anolis carolinensis]|eukprot:XP_016854375.1 PREDICTED: cytochrome P450 2B11 [Anolis carolinensis]